MNAFDIFDSDGDGYLNEEEVGHVLRVNGYIVSNKQINELCMTSPNPQQISAQDLARFSLSLPKSSAKSTQDLMEAFRVFDREENGLITENDIRVIFSTLGETVTLEEINSILGKCTIDENGKVKYADFVKLIIS